MTQLPDLPSLQLELETATQPISVFKAALANCRDSLEAAFHKGTDVEQLINQHADFVDLILQAAWSRFSWDENSASWRKTRIALVAVGGYGRGELHPHSDIDLLILLERNSYDRHAANIQSFLALLWDIGLEVGHSVRSIKECKVQASQDVTVITSLMEARTICGDPELFERVQKLITPRRIWTEKAFYRAKVAEQLERHRNSAHTEYSLEPNVKTSPGGLRDIQTVMWIARRKYGKVDFDGLVELNFLTISERDILREGERLLWKIRYALHLVAGREDDRLLFEYQHKLALMFGYKDGDQLAVEQFMQAYYRAAKMIAATSDMLLQHFDEAIINSRAKSKVEPINERFQIHNKYIEVTSPDIFRDYPPALIEIFLHIGANPNISGTRAETIRLIRQHLYLIDDEFRNSPEVTTMFLELLRSSDRLSSQLQRMERYGILGLYLPEFGRVVGQMQFDLFHIYTVDAHTLQVVRNMRRFRYRNQEQRFPVAAHIYHRLPKIELLFIAGLYHDIAKGMGGDHSELGVGIARKFCERHRLGSWDTNLVCWLVEQHLVMSSTAQRKDISDPAVIHEFASLVQHQTRLDYLYALTVADITATNPTLWNSWRASLMRQLYTETKNALRHGLENHVDKKDYIFETQNHAIDRLADYGLDRGQILAIWGKVDEDYFVRESVTDIVRHTLAIKDHNLDDGPLVLIHELKNRLEKTGPTQIFIYARVKDYLFASTVTALDLLGLNVVDARIARNENLAFDTFVVLDDRSKSQGSTPKSRHDAIRKKISTYLSREEKAKPRTNQRTPRLLRHFQFKTEITTSRNETNNLTVVEVITPDRPGLLSVIGNIFVELEIQVHSAKITTLGERVEDMFYVTDMHDQPLTDTSRLAQRLSEELDEHIQKAIA